MVWFTITTLVKPLNPWSKSGLYHQKRSETPKNITKYGITINLVDIRLRKNSFNLHNPLLIRIRDALESFRRMRYLINGFWFTINITKNKKLNINDDTVFAQLMTHVGKIVKDLVVLRESFKIPSMFMNESIKVDRLRARRSDFAAENEHFTASDDFTAPMELKNKEKRELLRDIKYQSAELRETGHVQSNSQVNMTI